MDLHWPKNLMTFFTFVAPLAAIGLVRGDMEMQWTVLLWVISAQIHGGALLLLVLPRKSNLFPDLSTSAQ